MTVLDMFLDLLYPPRCMLCRKILPSSKESICTKCAGRIPALMSDASRRDVKYIRLCFAPFQYRDEIRSSLHRYKFSGAAAYGPIYADFIAKSIDEKGISCDIISWVPLSKRRLRERGYDQAEIIARALAKKMGLPCTALLVKVKENVRQSTIKSREERKSNVSGAYRCIAKEELLSKRVLIVDDIITSGATVSSCASELKTAGCNEIYAVAAAIKSL